MTQKSKGGKDSPEKSPPSGGESELASALGSREQPSEKSSEGSDPDQQRGKRRGKGGERVKIFTLCPLTWKCGLVSQNGYRDKAVSVATYLQCLQYTLFSIGAGMPSTLCNHCRGVCFYWGSHNNRQCIYKYN